MGAYRRGNAAAIGALVGQSGDRTWRWQEFVNELVIEHQHLVALWPSVRAQAQTGALTQADFIAWNAIVYRQQGIELQVAAETARLAGGRYEAGSGLGVFAGLPGGGATIPTDAQGQAIDPRFRVPKVAVRGGSALGAGFVVGIVPLVIGAWILVGVIAAMLAGYTITSVADSITGQKTARENYAANMRLRENLSARYAAYADAERAAGRMPMSLAEYVSSAAPKPPPPTGSSLGLGIALGAAVLGGGYYFATRRPTRSVPAMAT